MRLPSLHGVLSLAALVPLSLAGPSYFYITQPALNDQWPQGEAHAARWIHAVDGIDIVDVELARLSSNGLLFIAREVPTKWGSLNLLFEGVPAGDDYYMVFLNVTHGAIYSISDRFTILDPSNSSTGVGSLAPDPAKPTVTVTGWPNPNQTWVATFGPDAPGAVALFPSTIKAVATAMACTFVGALAGTAWSLL